MKYLSLNEEAVLLAVWKLEHSAYPVAIRDLVNKMMKRDIVYGTLYNTLEYLLKKGYVFSEKGDPTPERGGKRKVFFFLTAAGIEALQRVRDVRRSIWDGVPELGLDRGRS
jgi:PadR family transcriptional regulator